jgi:hypothetical protein
VPAGVGVDVAKQATTSTCVRVRVEIMGAQKCRIVGKSQSVLIVTNPMISTRTRMHLLRQG